jgi:protein-disulfide isomerase
LRNKSGLVAGAILGSALLICANVLLADDWVRVPSPGSSSDSESTHHSNSESTTPAIANHPQRGDDNAPVTIVEYSDFQCPYCRQVEAALREVLTKYNGQVRLVYMDFPLPFHKHAMDAAMAARCADEQGQFWAYHDELIKDPSNLSTPALETTARNLGLDLPTFDACLEERKYERAVLADEKHGKRIGANGTPYLVIGSRSMSGSQPVSVLESAIDEQLRDSR